jgi:hypothetical protein
MADSVSLPENVISVSSEDESESVAIDGSVNMVRNVSQQPIIQFSAEEVSKKRKKGRRGKGKKANFSFPNPGKMRKKQQQEEL